MNGLTICCFATLVPNYPCLALIENCVKALSKMPTVWPLPDLQVNKSKITTSKKLELYKSDVINKE